MTKLARRSFLLNSGAVAIMVAAGGVWRIFGQEGPEVPDGPAFEPWRNWQQEANEGTLRLVRAAILSSNAYNSQPWLFRVSDRQIDLHVDCRRNLGAFDPYMRESYFSVGCALENLLIAAAATGYKASIRWTTGTLVAIPPAPAPDLAASIDLAPQRAVENELYHAIPHRHTNREPFDAARPLPRHFVSELHQLLRNEPAVRLFTFEEHDEITRIVELIASSTGKFLSDADVRQSVRPWLRTSSAQLQKLRDGFLPDARQSRYGTLEAYADLMHTARLFGIIAVRDRYQRQLTVRAGRIWQRAHLLATARGLAARPANGAVELIDHEHRLGLPADAASQLMKFTKSSAWQPTFMFYMGYATAPAQASVRRAVEDVEMNPDLKPQG